jgi:hypothetical protein
MGRISEPKGDDELTYNEELHNLFASPGILMMIKSRSNRCVACVERVEEASPQFGSESLREDFMFSLSHNILRD